MSKTIYVSRRTRNVAAQGAVRWELPEFKVTIDRRELARFVAKRLERKVRDSVKWAPSQWQGFARWLEPRIVATEDAVEYPDSDAFRRFAAEGNQFGLTEDVVERTMDEAIAEYLEGVMP